MLHFFIITMHSSVHLRSVDLIANRQVRDAREVRLRSGKDA